MILILPVTSRESLSAVSILGGFVESMYRDAPDPCSAGLFWFVEGDAYRVGSDTGPDGTPLLVLAPELEAVAQGLPG